MIKMNSEVFGKLHLTITKKNLTTLNHSSLVVMIKKKEMEYY